MTRTVFVTLTLSLLLGAAEPTFAQAPNFCDWSGPWASVNPMASRRDGATATVLQNGKVLIVGGTDGLNTVAAAELYDPATGVFSTTGSLATSRLAHVATLLADGRVLVAGGIQLAKGTFIARLASAEIFDPATGTFSPTPAMAVSRQNAAAVLLPNGKVLVTGGFGGPSSIWQATAELFDPATGAFALTGSMATGRGIHQMTRLPNGKILVTGGANGGGVTNTGELFDQATGAFSPTGAMTAARQFHTATLMPTGRVIVTGGSNASGFLASTEQFDPATNTFSASSSMTTARAGHTGTLLPIGKLLVAGGENSGGALATVEILNTFGFATVSSMPAARTAHTAALLASGDVLFAGGRAPTALETAVLFDPLFSGAGVMTNARSQHTATRLASGHVLVTGGQSSDAGNPPLASAELYNPTARTFALTGSMSTARHFHQATLLADGSVLATGGLSAFITGYLASAERFDPITGSFSPVGSMATARSRHTATRLLNGKVLIAGGGVSGGITASAELYDLTTNTFSPTGSMVRDRTGHTATLLPNGKVLITGGESNGAGGIAFSTELYDPATGTFTQPPQAQWLWTNRTQHVATLLMTGRVLITGGFTSGNTPTNKAEVYDPANGFFSPVADMSSPRANHAVVDTNLPASEVLIIGGTGAFVGGALDSVEVYDPAAGTFTSKGSLFNKRVNLTATLLLDSSVVVIGGSGDAPADATAEISKPTRCGPAITFVSPLAGLAGAAVSITGSQFGGLQGGSTVTFNGTSAGVSSWTDTAISTNVPAGATTGPLTVIVNGRPSNAVTFTVGAPDLIIQSIVTNPVAPAPGQTATVTVTARNQGTAPAGQFFVDFYAHLSSPPAGFGDFACSFSGLAPGATVPCAGTWTYAAGTYSMWAQVDLDHIVTETNEGNNIVGPQTLNVQSGPPDLVETAVSNPPGTIAPGGAFVVNDSAANNGSGAAGSSTTRYYLSLDMIRSGGDKRLSGTRAVPAIAAAGPPSTGAANVSVPTNTALGTYFLLACADDQKVVAESNETNNCIASATSVQVIAPPDLVETSVSNPPAGAPRGSSFNVTDTVSNQGGSAAAGSTTRYYLSLDAIRNSGDKRLTGARSVPGLAAGAPSTGAVNVTIPNSTVPGTYYLLACADDTKGVAEGNETNNCVASVTRVVVP